MITLSRGFHGIRVAKKNAHKISMPVRQNMKPVPCFIPMELNQYRSILKYNMRYMQTTTQGEGSKQEKITIEEENKIREEVVLNVEKNVDNEGIQKDENIMRFNEENERELQEELPNDPAVVYDDVIPTVVKIAAVSIAIPFIGFSITPFFLPLQLAGQSVFLQMTLGSAVLSFMGATHWGLAMSGYKRDDFIDVESSEEAKTPVPSNMEQTMRYVGALAYPIASWMILCLPPVEGMVGLMVAFSAFHMIEMVAHNRALTPSWYIRLKHPLTLGILISLGINLIHML